MLADILSNIHNQNADQLVAEAERILEEISNRDFSQSDRRATEELAKAEDSQYQELNEIFGISNRIPTRGPVVMYTSCHGATIMMTNCTNVSQKYSSACYHGI